MLRVVCVSVCPYATQHRAETLGATWSVVAGAAFGGRHSHAMVALPGDVLIVAGGVVAETGLPTSDVWRSDDAAQSWWLQTATASFAPRYGHSAVVLEGSIHILGGFGSDSLETFSDVHRSDDAGRSWTLVSASSDTPWAGRGRFGAVVTPSDAIIIVGGSDGGSTVFTDVWASADGGISWRLVATDAPPRHSFGLATMPGGDIFLYGGANSTAGDTTNNCLRSSDGGVSWSEEASLSALGWMGALGGRALVSNGMLFVIGGQHDSHIPEIYRSLDEGVSFEVQMTGTPTRLFFAAAVLGTGSLVLSGGIAGVTSSDSLVSEMTGAHRWYDQDCSLSARALCGAPPSSTALTVSLPASVGRVVPANAASEPVQIAYAPPVPSITVKGESSLVTTDSVEFEVTWSSPVSALDAFDFTVSWPGSLGERSLIGEGVEWTFTVHLGELPSICPSGFRSSAGLGLCARVIHSAATWETQNAACAPFTLATAASDAEMLFFAELLSNTQDAWYVPAACRSAASKLMAAATIAGSASTVALARLPWSLRGRAATLSTPTSCRGMTACRRAVLLDAGYCTLDTVRSAVLRARWPFHVVTRGASRCARLEPRVSCNRERVFVRSARADSTCCVIGRLACAHRRLGWQRVCAVRCAQES